MATMSEKVAEEIMREIQQKRGGKRIGDMLGRSMQVYDSNADEYDKNGYYVGPSQPLRSGQEGGYPYFCLHCNTIEVYAEVPRQNGESMRPWHEHEGAQVAMRAIKTEMVPLLVSRGVSVKYTKSLNGQRQREGLPLLPGPSQSPLLDHGRDRLQAVLEKVAKEGW